MREEVAFAPFGFDVILDALGHRFKEDGASKRIWARVCGAGNGQFFCSMFPYGDPLYDALGFPWTFRLQEVLVLLLHLLRTQLCEVSVD